MTREQIEWHEYVERRVMNLTLSAFEIKPDLGFSVDHVARMMRRGILEEMQEFQSPAVAPRLSLRDDASKPSEASLTI